MDCANIARQICVSVLMDLIVIFFLEEGINMFTAIPSLCDKNHVPLKCTFVESVFFSCTCSAPSHHPWLYYAQPSLQSNFSPNVAFLPLFKQVQQQKPCLTVGHKQLLIDDTWVWGRGM